MAAWQRLFGGSRSAAPLAWGLIPLFLIIGIIIFFFGDLDARHDGIHIMERAPTGERVWLGSADIPDHAWSAAFIAPNDEVRTALLESLSSFRGERVQQGVQLEVSAADANEAGRQVARQIGSALGQYGVGRARTASTTGPAPITQLRASPRDRGLVLHLLSALSPYLKGEIWIQYDESASTRSMTLHLADDPLFANDGTVWYGLDVHE